MATALDWEPDPFQPDSVVRATGAATTYRVTRCASGMTSSGAFMALAGDHLIGRFPNTPAGRQAALTACESHAAFVGDSLRAQAQVEDPDQAFAHSS